MGVLIARRATSARPKATRAVSDAQTGSCRSARPSPLRSSTVADEASASSSLNPSTLAGILAKPPAPELQEPTEAAPAPPPQAARHRAGVEDEIPRLQPLSAAAKRSCLERRQLALGAAGLDEIVCAVCDSWMLATSCRVIKVSDCNRVRQIRQVLSSNGEALPAELVAQYDCSSRSPALAGLLLSERGVRPDGRIDVCADCDNSLAKDSIPKFSIKNGFAIGTLPTHLADASLPERLITQPVSVVAVTRVMRGGAHRFIRSHCLAFDCAPAPAATLLPIQPDCISTYRVVLAGPFTTEQ
ncbi:hypothetical protein PR001_g6712 [Phytophthora rubi]|uniref:DUF6570 domain-containing protein n=2 Tax=Phytophthora rubi TaxID=129364 RepID=A0A6A3N763_9STRA|nr:hypothetical protein PR001_g6712 [Phytophthora rubi]